MKRLLVVFAILALFVVLPSPVIAEGPSVQASFGAPLGNPSSMPLDVAGLNWERHWPANMQCPQCSPISGSSSAQPVGYSGNAVDAQVAVVNDGFRLVLDWESSRTGSFRVDSKTQYKPYIEATKLAQRIDELSVAHRVRQDAVSLGLSYDVLKRAKHFVVAPGAGMQWWLVRGDMKGEYTEARTLSPLIGTGPIQLQILQHDVRTVEKTWDRLLPFVSMDVQGWPWGKHRKVGLVAHARYVMGDVSHDPTASSLTQEYGIPIRQKRLQGRVGLAVAF